MFAPATGRLHGGCVGEGAWLDEGCGPARDRTRARHRQLVAVASKSHLNQATVDYLEPRVGLCRLCRARLAASNSASSPKARRTSIRALSPTSEWDTAAGHAVLLAAGGRVDGPDGEPLGYGKPAFLNRGFVATGGWPAPAIAPFLGLFAGGGEIPQGLQ